MSPLSENWVVVKVRVIDCNTSLGGTDVDDVVVDAADVVAAVVVVDATVVDDAC